MRNNQWLNNIKNWFFITVGFTTGKTYKDDRFSIIFFLKWGVNLDFYLILEAKFLSILSINRNFFDEETQNQNVRSTNKTVLT